MLTTDLLIGYVRAIEFAGGANAVKRGSLSLSESSVPMQSRKEVAMTFQRLIVAGKVREAYEKYVHRDFRHHKREVISGTAR